MRTATFIRHAQSAANAGEVTEDVSQIGLTPCGRVEALKLASSFSEPPTLIVVSPYLRTRLTAQPTIYRVPDVPVEEWPVQEFTYLEPSRWNGTSPAERRPVVAEWWAKAGPGYRAGTGSESFSDLLRRARNTLERLERLPERNRVFVFTHGQFMQALRLLLIFPRDTDKAQMARFRDFDREQPIENSALFSIGMDRWTPWQFMYRSSGARPMRTHEEMADRSEESMLENMERKLAWGEGQLNRLSLEEQNRLAEKYALLREEELHYPTWRL